MDKYALYVPFVMFLLAILAYVFSSPRHNKTKHQIKKTKLPPGSLGWPYIGETLQLYYQDPENFFSNRQKRYGDIFKTNILGCPCVMLASPDAARYVLMSHADLFKPTYPKSKENLIGMNALFFHQGEYYTRLRKLIQGPLYPESLRNLVTGIEALTVSALSSWADGRVITIFDEMKKLSFQVGILTIFGNLEPHYMEQLKNKYVIVSRGYNSFPTHFPGTLYHKATKARKELGEILNKITKERKENNLVEKDMISYMLNSKDDKGEALNEDQIADNIIGVLFAAQDTTASALTWILKFLHDNPTHLEAVKAEQKEIYQANLSENCNLTWNQTRKMPVTNKVILESLRIASIISFSFREAVTDVEYKGYFIPKGWKVMPLFRNIHHNPEIFAEPQKFDPTRFDDGPKPNTYMPFGSGLRSCPGNELAKLEMFILIHHIASHFRYELVGSPSKIQYSPFPVPLHGLPARFYKA